MVLRLLRSCRATSSSTRRSEVTRAARSSPTSASGTGSSGRSAAASSLAAFARRSWSPRSSSSASPRRSATTATGPDLVDPRATPFVIGARRPQGLQAGRPRPRARGRRSPTARPTSSPTSTGNPIRLADLRGKVVWLNFWASWCPPCQQETPILRELVGARTATAGLEVVGVSVQETTADRRQGVRRAVRAALHDRLRRLRATSSTRTRSSRCRPSSSSTRTASSSRSSSGPVDEAGRSGADRVDAAAGSRRAIGESPSRRVASPRSARSGSGRGRGRGGRPGACASCERTTIQPSSAAWANSSALRTTESSGKSSNAVTQRGFAAHGRMNRSPKNASVSAVVAAAAHDDRLVPGRVAAGRDDR